MERIAEGVHRLGTPLVSWYLVEDGDRLTVVDAGMPRYRGQLDEALAQLGRSLSDVEAVVLTHAHPDHTGFAEALRAETGVPVLVHEADAKMARTAKTPLGERGLLPYLAKPAVWRLFGHMAANGARPRKIAEVTTFAGGHVLDVPGRPHVVHAPGHSPGCCALHLPDRGVLLTGDVLCSRNPMTGRDGPQIMPGSFTRDIGQALDSLARIESLDASVLGFGHGDPWTDGAASAVARARELGPS
jgi:glyoxylase-like metal-dependent hydrolase (beta-lactamase superfamily II)